jgi:hypothetical protein
VICGQNGMVGGSVSEGIRAPRCRWEALSWVQAQGKGGMVRRGIMS